MDKLKINKYNEETGLIFPKFESLRKETCEDIRDLIATNLLRNDLVDNNVLMSIKSKSTYIENYNATNDNFSFIDLLHTLELLIPEFIFINWYRFDEIDKIETKIFDKFFDYIWYPGTDDIDVISENFGWIINIDDAGFISIYRRN